MRIARIVASAVLVGASGLLIAACGAPDISAITPPHIKVSGDQQVSGDGNNASCKHKGSGSSSTITVDLDLQSPWDLGFLVSGAPGTYKAVDTLTVVGNGKELSDPAAVFYVAKSGTLTVNSDGRSGSVDAEAKGGNPKASSPTGTIHITGQWSCRK